MPVIQGINSCVTGLFRHTLIIYPNRISAAMCRQSDEQKQEVERLLPFLPTRLTFAAFLSPRFVDLFFLDFSPSPTLLSIDNVLPRRCSPGRQGRQCRSHPVGRRTFLPLVHHHPPSPSPPSPINPPPYRSHLPPQFFCLKPQLHREEQLGYRAG